GKAQDPQFETGNCMSCGSKVRWPKSLSHYRCTVCQCVNDLKPRSEQEDDKNETAATMERTGAEKEMLVPARLSPEAISREKRSVKEPLRHSRNSESQKNHDRPVSLTASPRRNDRSIPSLVPQPPSRRPPPPPSPEVHAASRNSSPALHMDELGDRPSDRHVEEMKSQKDRNQDLLRTSFLPLEVYLRSSFGNLECLNTQFSTARPIPAGRTRSESSVAVLVPRQVHDQGLSFGLSEVNGKTLRVGDVAENAALWMGGGDESKAQQQQKALTTRRRSRSAKFVSRRSPHIDWEALQQWYDAVLNVVDRWQTQHGAKDANGQGDHEDEAGLAAACTHVHHLLLKITENLLKRPGRPLNEPQHLRFLLLIIANPLLHDKQDGTHTQAFKHSNIVKRTLGLLAHAPEAARNYLHTWFANLPLEQHAESLSLCERYLNYRLSRCRSVLEAGALDGVSRSPESGGYAGDHGRLSMVSQMPSTRALEGDQALLPEHVELPKQADFSSDTGSVSAAICIGIFWAANLCRPPPLRQPTSSWYNLILDSFGEAALIEDFRAWESRKQKFTFCSFPFLLSMSAKIRILAFDANRQQTDEARKAWFQQFTTNHAVQSNLHIHVRRDCLAADTLNEIRAVTGATQSQNELKKGLRVHFEGEDGVDAGGLRKEFFILLMRELLDPNHGLVEYDEDSNYCYFNPNTLEDTEQFFLLGTLVGLAIYNSTILDIPFPPFLFKKLLLSASSSSPIPHDAYDFTLDDLAQFRPALARGLQQLLDFDGDVESVFCRTFVVEIDRYGKKESFPLVHNMPDTLVTNANRTDFVRLLVNFCIHDSVARQFDPFKRGFFAVCGGNALSLFQPEELELLVRGSDNPLDVDTLMAVAVYEGWHVEEPAQQVDVLVWFWQFFRSLARAEQRKLLGFITGSDRVPALGETSLVIRLQCVGEEDSEHLPVARTCFNMIQLYSYSSEEKLRTKLWTAVTESAGFLLK
ncbi:hypothetical protein NA57DRAFT_21925, partial [Rhizodiscina lignyota]